jgi:hypothetical protein
MLRSTRTSAPTHRDRPNVAAPYTGDGGSIPTQNGHNRTQIGYKGTHAGLFAYSEQRTWPLKGIAQ